MNAENSSHPNLLDHIDKAFAKREIESSLRKLKLPAREGLIDFYSNDYLGLASNEALIQEISQKLGQIPKLYGSTGSRLLSGNSSIAEEIEAEFAKFYHSEKGLFFSNGYLANLGIYSCLPKKGDTIFYDELSHASIKDGIRLSLAEKFSFKHNDLEDIRKKIIKNRSGNVFVAIESLYSMDGDYAPQAELVALARELNFYLIVDEAHTTAWYGKNGKGWAIESGFEKKFLIRNYTFGKGMGCHGAFVAADAKIIDYMINFSRPFIYTTAPPIHQILVAKMHHDFIKNNIQLLDNLNDTIKNFNSIVKFKNKQVQHSPIQTIIIPGNENVIKVSQKMLLHGFDVRPVLSPTVKIGEERLRICLHASNTMQEIKAFALGIRNFT